MSYDERAEVESLMKRIFDPSGTVFAGRPFESTYLGATRTVRPMLVFTRYIASQWTTKLIVRFGDYFANDRSVVVVCLTYERLPPQAGVRVT
jgi:hypothetical protein